VTTRSHMVGVIGSVVCLLALLTFSILNVISNITVGELLLVFVPAWLGAVVFLGLLVAAKAERSRRWLLALGLVAAWGLGVGALAAFSNVSAINFHQDMVDLVRERQERVRSGDVMDTKDRSDSEVQKSLDAANQDLQRYQQILDFHRTGLKLSSLLFLPGIIALVLLVRLLRQPATPSPA